LGTDAIGNVLFGTFLTIVVIVFLVVVARGVKKRLFPSQKEEVRSEAMTELLLLQAGLQKRASQLSSREGEEREADSGEIGGGGVHVPGLEP
jgi:hypothetical protein